MDEWRNGWKENRWIYFYRQRHIPDLSFSNQILLRSQPLRNQNELLTLCLHLSCIFALWASASLRTQYSSYPFDLWLSPGSVQCHVGRGDNVPFLAQAFRLPSFDLPSYISTVVMRSTFSESQMSLSPQLEKAQGKIWPSWTFTLQLGHLVWPPSWSNISPDTTGYKRVCPIWAQPRLAKPQVTYMSCNKLLLLSVAETWGGLLHSIVVVFLTQHPRDRHLTNLLGFSFWVTQLWKYEADISGDICCSFIWIHGLITSSGCQGS